MFKNKLLLLSPVIALLVVFIFSLTLFPTVQPQPKNLPIAIVNEDQGVEIPNQPKMNMGQTIVDNMKKTSKSEEEPAVKWVEVKNKESVQKGLNNQEYYAALVIPKDFSTKQALLRTPQPSSPEVEIFINQGMNTAASTMAGQMLNAVVDNMNNTVRTQLLEGYKAKGATLTADQVSKVVTPIAKKVTNVNETGKNSANGNSPMSLFQPLWIASLASAAIIFIAISKIPVGTRKENFLLKLKQIITGAIATLVIGFGLTWIADGMVGLNITNFTDTALFLSITSFSFFLMISAVLSLVGLKGIGVFALLLFFGAPLLSLAPEMLSPFYQDWVYAWLPMRFMIEGLREIFFFGKDLSWSTPVTVLVWIGVVSMMIILATAFKRVVKEHKTEVNA
ncbi:phage infection protein (plasmid) [Bacillus cereus]|uniref:ABC-2 family transporter protein n=2 Tax=Bacillaceae TaxID=186817 RepID=A0A1Y5Z3G9_9BACI|nr:ABC-2 family transporter protein [Bacillus cereus]SMD76194.1 ABC-2 family transporter protein [Bacillus mobilis]BCC21032.1 phage infection protein [Bacillus cereus]BCC32682.1 phage infection protein [Bacillus cereus]BCC50070.1 phage infection protein [Bacillus cereus]